MAQADDAASAVDQRTAKARRAAGSANASWYHTIDLAESVSTPGMVDLRKVAERLLPADLTGKRTVDVASCEGFWAFELERRGAEVVSVDIASVDQLDVLPNRRQELAPRLEAFENELGSKFALARDILGSSVRRIGCSVYDLSEEAIEGTVDVAFIGTVLLHLRDPVGALERVLGVLRPAGTVLAIEPISLRDTLRSPRRPVARFEPLITEWNWWYPNLAAVKAMFVTAGFEDVRSRGIHRPPAIKVMRQWYVGIEAQRPGG